MNIFTAINVERGYQKAVKDAIVASEKEGVVVLENGTEVRTASIPARTPRQVEAINSIRKFVKIGGGVTAGIVGGIIIGKRVHDKRAAKEELTLLPETEEDPYLITDEGDSDTTVTTED